LAKDWRSPALIDFEPVGELIDFERTLTQRLKINSPRAHQRVMNDGANFLKSLRLIE